MALRMLLLDLRRDASANAQKCWSAHKSPMAMYWKVVAVYAGHIARLLRDPAPCEAVGDPLPNADDGGDTLNGSVREAA